MSCDRPYPPCFPPPLRQRSHAAPRLAADWMQFGYDAAHTGYNPAETTISPANVASLVTKLYSVNLAAYGRQRAGVSLECLDRGRHARTCCSRSATTAASWRSTPRPAPRSGTRRRAARSRRPLRPRSIRAGNTSTATASTARRTNTRSATAPRSRPAAGRSSITLEDQCRERRRRGLTIANSGGVNWLYVVTDGYIGDGGDYQGHVTTINLSTGAQVVFNTLCSNAHDASRQRRLRNASERHLGPRRRDVRCRHRSRLRRDRQRPVQREHRRLQLGRLDARARARRHRRRRRHAARQLHADELPAARRSGHRSRLDLARDHEAAVRQHRRASRHADRQGCEAAPDQPRQHERRGRPCARRRRDPAHRTCRKAAAACASSRRRGSTAAAPHGSSSRTAAASRA